MLVAYELKLVVDVQNVIFEAFKIMPLLVVGRYGVPAKIQR